jgi:hypothetical protein
MRVISIKEDGLPLLVTRDRIGQEGSIVTAILFNALLQSVGFQVMINNYFTKPTWITSG